MKKTLFALVALTLAMESCNGKSETPEPEHLEVQTAPQLEEGDSSILGVATENYGMNTFSLKTDDGTELELVRSHEDGTVARMLGDVKEGDRFAVTLADNKTAVGVAINTTQLHSHLQKLSKADAESLAFLNGRIILRVSGVLDTLTIETLDADSLVMSGRTTYRVGK